MLEPLKSLHDNSSCVYFHIGAIVEENGGHEAAKGQACQNTERIGENGVAARQNCMHFG